MKSFKFIFIIIFFSVIGCDTNTIKNNDSKISAKDTFTRTYIPFGMKSYFSKNFSLDKNNFELRIVYSKGLNLSEKLFIIKIDRLKSISVEEQKLSRNPKLNDFELFKLKSKKTIILGSNKDTFLANLYFSNINIYPRNFIYDAEKISTMDSDLYYVEFHFNNECFHYCYTEIDSKKNKYLHFNRLINFYNFIEMKYGTFKLY